MIKLKLLIWNNSCTLCKVSIAEREVVNQGWPTQSPPATNCCWQPCHFIFAPTSTLSNHIISDRFCFFILVPILSNKHNLTCCFPAQFNRYTLEVAVLCWERNLPHVCLHSSSNSRWQKCTLSRNLNSSSCPKWEIQETNLVIIYL